MAGDVILSTGSDELVINMGPHHPSTHGVIRFIVRTDGEIMREADPDVGYLHRAIEHIAEKCSYEGFMPYTDRVDYLGAMTANHVWAMAVEKLADLAVPERAEWLRMISDELNRIASHLVMVGAMAMDIGAITPFTHMLREREYINDLLEELCGARLTYNYHRIGGVAKDVPEGWRDKVLAFLDRFEPIIDEFNRLITENQIFVNRLGGVAAVPGAEAIAYGLVGPNLRASGVDFDLRRDHPYSMYAKTEFRVPVGRGEKGAVGDCWDRFWLRVEECRESTKIVRQALVEIEKTPKGEVWAKPKKLKPTGEAYARVESVRGDLGCYVVADGGTSPCRAHFRTGSYTAMQIIKPKSAGMMVADLVALIASVDVVAPEIDR
ncbi:MAG: NADH-quinone oxidoreductase subunit D [Pseudomonadota bacterium]